MEPYGGGTLPKRSATVQSQEEAEVAQLVEQLIRNQQVIGSSPIFGSIRILLHLQEEQALAWFARKIAFTTACISSNP